MVLHLQIFYFADYQLPLFGKLYTVNQLIFADIYLRDFVFMDIFAAIYFRRELQNYMMREQCTVSLYGHFRSNLLSRISILRENKSLAKIYWFTVCYFVVVDRKRNCFLFCLGFGAPFDCATSWAFHLTLLIAKLILFTILI